MCDAGIQIFNTTEFANVAARHIPGVIRGFEGFCYYLDGAVECKVNDVNIEQFKSNKDDNKIDINMLGGHMLNAAGSAVFFRKAKNFSRQMEYRWVWRIDHEVDGSIIIRVPEARRFCLPLYLSDFI